MPTSSNSLFSKKDSDVKMVVEDLEGKYVTPGLVDMHSHHLVSSWPSVSNTGSGDGNEIHPDTGPLTPMVRAKDGAKSDDVGIEFIAAGGRDDEFGVAGECECYGLFVSFSPLSILSIFLSPSSFSDYERTIRKR